MALEINTTKKIVDFTLRYKRGEYVARPYRIKDSRKRSMKKNGSSGDLRWLCYSAPQRALEGADRAALWTDLGRTLEVYDCRNGDLHGTFRVHIGRNGKRTVTMVLTPLGQKHVKTMRALT